MEEEAPSATGKNTNTRPQIQDGRPATTPRDGSGLPRSVSGVSAGVLSPRPTWWTTSNACDGTSGLARSSLCTHHHAMSGHEAHDKMRPGTAATTATANHLRCAHRRALPRLSSGWDSPRHRRGVGSRLDQLWNLFADHLDQQHVQRTDDPNVQAYLAGSPSRTGAWTSWRTPTTWRLAFRGRGQQIQGPLDRPSGVLFCEHSQNSPGGQQHGTTTKAKR